MIMLIHSVRQLVIMDIQLFKINLNTLSVKVVKKITRIEILILKFQRNMCKFSCCEINNDGLAILNCLKNGNCGCCNRGNDNFGCCNRGVDNFGCCLVHNSGVGCFFCCIPKSECCCCCFNTFKLVSIQQN